MFFWLTSTVRSPWEVGDRGCEGTNGNQPQLMLHCCLCSWPSPWSFHLAPSSCHPCQLCSAFCLHPELQDMARTSCLGSSALPDPCFLWVHRAACPLLPMEPCLGLMCARCSAAAQYLPWSTLCLTTQAWLTSEAAPPALAPGTGSARGGPEIWVWSLCESRRCGEWQQDCPGDSQETWLLVPAAGPQAK